MRKKRFLATVTLGLLVALSSPHVSAIGWSRAQLSAVLGQPLDFNASLRLDPGDAPVAPDCVNAEVLAGERRLAADTYRVMVDTSSADAVRMRVLTRQAMDEPFITVTLAIGCPARLSRRFVLLADPPGHAMQPVVQAAVQAPAPAPAAPAPSRAPAPATARAPAAAADDRSPSRVMVAAAAAPVPPPRSAAAPRQERAAPEARRERSAAALRPGPAPPPAPAATAGPRLQLDPVEPAPTALAAAPDVIDAALLAVAEATRAAQAIAAAASASEARMLQLERTVEQLRTEATVNQDLVADLRRRLADRDGTGRWFVPLLLALLALAALAGWLWWRLRALEREQQAAWRRAAAAAPARPPPRASQVPMVTSAIMAPAPAVAPAPAAPLPARAYTPFTPLKPPHARPPAPPAAAPADDMPPTAGEHTDVLPRDAQPDAPRDVSIDELLDLEQQAEFFIVLGQDDAAIDLLVEHLRSTGGGSPLPYLKLLEIYRRRDDRAAYDRTRARFNHRFNAYAPGWDVDPAAGRALEDYPGIVPRLQQAWARPLDAMAELEALLFRKSRGELFDLPAYREVLFLYSLARDLLDRESVDTGSVDLLLPLADGGEFSSTSPHPYFGLERESVFDPLHDEHLHDRPTAPVDLDLTQPERPGALTERLTPRR